MTPATDLSHPSQGRGARCRHLATVVLLTSGLAAVMTLPAGGAPAGGATPVSSAPASRTLTILADAATVPALRWRGCGDGFQCARATVPLDYDKPEGSTVSLALTRLPATNPHRRIGSLLTNPGGPGTSGVVRIRGAREIFPASVRARFDIVGFDPRGVGHSSPVRCFGSNAAKTRFFAGVPIFPITRAQHVEFIAKAAEFGAACVRRNAAIMQHMSTTNVARDMDLLRRALGDRRLTFYGASYGSYLANVYANMFPDRVRAMVLDSIVEPTEWATGRGDGHAVPVLIRQGAQRGAHRTLQRFLRLCDRAGPACSFSAGAPRTKLDRLMASAKRAPIVVPTPQGPREVTYADIVSTTIKELSDPPRSWRALAGQLQALYEASRPARRAAATRTPAPSEPAPGGYVNTEEAYLSVLCTDTDNPGNPFAWPRAAARADQRFPYVGSAVAWSSEPCATWPVQDRERYTGPFDRWTAAPILVVGTRFDPLSPYRNARAVARQLPRAHLLTLDGWGHVALGKSSCITRHMAHYLVRGTLPPPLTVCRPDRRPFEGPAPARTGLRSDGAGLISQVPDHPSEGEQP